MPTTVIDTAAGFPSPEAIRLAGHAGLLAYVSPSRPGTSFPGKPITKAVLAQYLAAGVAVAPIWQLGKPGDPVTPSDWRTGRDGGRRMAKAARDAWFAAGGPGYTPFYFAVDEDITLDQWNAGAADFFRGAGEVLGPQWVGIYGHSRVCAWAAEDGVIGRTPDGQRYWAWQTRAWSGSEIAPEAVLYQRVIDTAAAPGPKVGGVTVDVNDVLADDWGQTGIDRAPGAVPAPPTSGGTAVIDPGVTVTILSGNNDGRRGSTDYAALHTQEAASTARKLAAYCQPGRSEVSYNGVVDDVDTILVVDWDLAPWAAVQANDCAFHLCFAGSFASWSTDRWLSKDASDGLDEDAMMWRGARLIAYVCQRYGIPVEWVGSLIAKSSNWPGKRGVTGHVAFGARGGGHTDPGVKYPVAEFIRRVKTFLAPPVNLIDAEAKIAAAWIGKRQAPAGATGETVLRKNGAEFARFVPYENGHVYWRTGDGEAYAVPHGGIFEAWGARGWERGECGLPVRRHQVFEWGGNQSFQGGTLFVVTGGDPRGHLVHGEIGKRYAAMGWETGPLGLPTSDEQPVAGTDNIVQTFEHGKLTWSPSGVIVDLANAVQ